MPSAATAKLEKQASTEAVDPIKQVIIVVEHKIRNLEKRKRKIESYREEEKNGKVLNSDQLNAVSKYNEVQQTLEFARELNKQFQGIAADAAKQQKKLARKEALERAQQEHAKVKEILLVQDVLQSMGQETVREDFLAGRNGAAQLTEEDLKYLDDLYVEVSPKHGAEEGTPSFQDQVNLSAEHLLAIVEGKPKELVGTTCAKLKEIVTTIVTCGYFDQSVEENAEETVGEPVATEGEVPTNAVPEEVATVTAAAVAVDEAAVYPVPEQPVVCPDETPPTFPAGAQPTFAPPQTQPARVINEVIGSVGGAFNFLQESELDTPDISAILTGAAAAVQQHSTPPPAAAAAAAGTVPVPVAPIPSQTFTNQNFAAVTTAPVQPQVVFQAPTEISQAHIPGFASATPNPPPPIPMPPSHQTQPAVPSQPSAQFASAAAVAAAAAATVQQQQQQIMSATFVSQAKQQQQPPAFVPAQQPKPDIAPAAVVPEQQPIPDTKTVAQGNTSEWQQVEAAAPSGDWGNTETQAAGDWGNPENAVAADDWKGTDNAGSGDEWQQVSSQGDWSNQTSEDWSTAGQTDSYTTQGGRNYGNRGGRGGRGGGGSRGSSNGYSGRGRGGSGYQNGRGGGSSGGGGYGYRSSEGGSNYYQNGYQQRDNFSGGNYAGGYKRGGRGGPGGPRGTGQRGGPGNRGGNNPRGGRGGNFPRGGGNKQ